ncbi:MAG: ORF6N domain-containing protein [Candidatus Margulisiibacteriota bacterium]
MAKQGKECVSAEKSDSLRIMPTECLDSMIFSLRGQRVMIDFDLAKLYGVSTKRINEQLKRNKRRFPDDFVFCLSYNEKQELVANCDRFRTLKHSSTLPYAFTEQGVAMLSTVLNSEHAILVNIAIMRAFVRIRQLISFNKDLVQKLAEIEHRLGRHDQDINELFAIVGRLLQFEEQPKKKFGFETGM